MCLIWPWEKGQMFCVASFWLIYFIYWLYKNNCAFITYSLLLTWSKTTPYKVMSSHIPLCFSFFVTLIIQMKWRDKCHYWFCHNIEIFSENHLKTFTRCMSIYIHNSSKHRVSDTLLENRTDTKISKVYRF